MAGGDVTGQIGVHSGVCWQQGRVIEQDVNQFCSTALELHQRLVEMVDGNYTVVNGGVIISYPTEPGSHHSIVISSRSVVWSVRRFRSDSDLIQYFNQWLCSYCTKPMLRGK